MFSVILLVIIAIAFGFFSTQNSMSIPITFGSAVIPDVPLYIALGVSLLIGLLYSWIINLVDSLFVNANLRKKDHAIMDTQKTNEQLNERIVQLEMENTRLHAEMKNDSVL